jgi:hypothetical protein
VRQLMALRTDLVCVSAPRKKITRRASLIFGHNLTRGTRRPRADGDRWAVRAIPCILP